MASEIEITTRRNALLHAQKWSPVCAPGVKLANMPRCRNTYGASDYCHRKTPIWAVAEAEVRRFTSMLAGF
jgi:hypothetical protein